MINSEIFRLYDIQEAEPGQMSPSAAAAIGYGFGKVMKARTVVIGSDFRQNSFEMTAALKAGLEHSGAKVIDVGMCIMEAMMFAAGSQYADGSIMVTGEDQRLDVTGLRMAGPDCMPLRPDQITQIKAAAMGASVPPARVRGDTDTPGYAMGYAKYVARVLAKFGDWPPDTTSFTVVIDGGYSRAGSTFFHVADFLDLPKNIKLLPLSEIDRGPNLSTNPDDWPRMERLRGAMLKMGADLGLSWSGDGGRLRVYTKYGIQVNGVHLGAYLAAAIGQVYPKEPLVCDQAAMFPMLNACGEMGLSLAPSLPGSTPMQVSMRHGGASFGAELSGRYYFKDLWWSESSMLAAFLTMHMAYLTPMPFAEVMQSLGAVFPVHGEHTIPVQNVGAALDHIRANMAEGENKTHRSDLVQDEQVYRSIDKEYDWRMVIRPSPTTRGAIGLTAEGHGRVNNLILGGMVKKVMAWAGEVE